MTDFVQLAMSLSPHFDLAAFVGELTKAMEQTEEGFATLESSVGKEATPAELLGSLHKVIKILQRATSTFQKAERKLQSFT